MKIKYQGSMSGAAVDGRYYIPRGKAREVPDEIGQRLIEENPIDWIEPVEIEAVQIEEDHNAE